MNWTTPEIVGLAFGATTLIGMSGGVFIRVGKVLQKVESGFEANDKQHAKINGTLVEHNIMLANYGNRLSVVETKLGAEVPDDGE